MKTAFVIQNQTLFELAVLYYGSAEGIFPLMDDNPHLTWWENPAPGTEIKIKSTPLDPRIVDYFAAKESKPATQVSVAVQKGTINIIDQNQNSLGSYQIALGDNITEMINITNSAGSFTYSELENLVTNNQLNVGSYYLLNDFETIYDRPDYEDNNGNIVPKTTIETVNSGVVEPLLLLAISSNEFARQVYSPLFPKDYIEYDFNYRQTWVNANPAKGRITRRVDEFQNEANHDFRTITFKRYDRNGDGNFKWYWDSGGDDFVLKHTYGEGCVNNIVDLINYFILGFVTGFDLDNCVSGDDCVFTQKGFLSRNINYGNNCGSIYFKDFVEGLVLGDNIDALIIEYGGDFSQIDFTNETLLSGIFNKWIYKDATDGIKLRYFNGGNLIIANVND